MDSEVIVVGSGATAVHLAQTLVEAHRKVLMLDVGVTQPHNDLFSETDIKNDASFTDLRSTDKNQYKYLLGNHLESINWGTIGVGAQLTPARRYMIQHIDELIPYDSKNFSPYESLAVGGLGVGWGAGCYEFSPEELIRCGLNVSQIQKAYKVVSDRIGISTPGIDIKPFSANSFVPTEQQIQISEMFKKIIQSYENNKNDLNKNNFYLGQPSLALLSKKRLTRKAHTYRELEFYDDSEKSVYRPWMTLDQLRLNSNFKYVSNVMVTQFVEAVDSVQVMAIEVHTKEKLKFSAQILSLATGALGSARIVLRSSNIREAVPLLCNDYAYYPALRWSHLGQKTETRCTALAQLMMFHNQNGSNQDIATASLYAYKSLMLFRLIKESPLNFEISNKLFQFLQSGLVIYGIHHPDEFDVSRKSLKLEDMENSLTGDKLEINFERSCAATQSHFAREKNFCWAMKKLGCYPIKRVNPGYGSSIHYGGTLPISDIEKPNHLNRDRKLHATQRVYVADGAGLNFLPAKGLTLTLMAMGHATGENILKKMGSSQQ